MRKVVYRHSKSNLGILDVNREYWPELDDLTSGISTEVLRLRAASIPISGLHRILHSFLCRKESFGWSSVLETVKQSQLRILLALDSPTLPIEKIGAINSHLKILLIAHGSLRRHHMSSYAHLVDSVNSKILFLVWGKHDRDLIVSNFGSRANCEIVGSLRNAVYLRDRKRRYPQNLRHQIVFVSQFAGTRRETSFHSGAARPRILASLKNYLQQFCREEGISLHVALRPRVSGDLEPGQWESEIAHYRQVFKGVEVTFTDPRIPYATYSASDAGEVTVGVPAGSLTESFGRGNKVLMFGQSIESGDQFGFPFKGPWLVNEPSYSDFSDALNQIRQMSSGEYHEASNASRSEILAHSNSDSPIRLIREKILHSLD